MQLTFHIRVYRKLTKKKLARNICVYLILYNKPSSKGSYNTYLKLNQTIS